MTYKRTFDDTWTFKDANIKEYTHCYHTYPAMLCPLIVRRLIEEYAPNSGGVNLLFDPYMGSGTSLVEANVAGIDAVGTDLNPLARFMSKVKTMHYDSGLIKQELSSIQEGIKAYDESKVSELPTR